MRHANPARTAAAVIIVLCLAGSGCTGGPQWEPSSPYVTSDTANLSAALVWPLGDHIFKSSEMGSGLTFFSVGLPKGTIDQHAAMVRVMERAGVNVLNIPDVLDSAVRNARSQGALAEWLRETYPATAEQSIQRLDELDGRSLLNMRDDHFYLQNPEGEFDPLFPGMSSFYWARDFAATTSKGVIIGRSSNNSRFTEMAFTRLMFRYADLLKDIPVVFDAGEEDVNLEGGDIIVVSEQELLLGVGNRSDRVAAPMLARKLGMDVIAVSMPPSDRRSGLQRQLLHLDSIFNLVDTNTVLAVPFFLEKEYSDSNPMKPVLLGLARQMETLRELDTDASVGNPTSLRTTVEIMSEVGWVTRYEAGTGDSTALDMKLLDYMRERGYTVVYVGGEQGELAIEKYTLERAMYELRWQGANVIQLGPGRIIAYEHNTYTNQALRNAGIKVYTFPGSLLSMRNGGPHCLVMPLIRGK